MGVSGSRFTAEGTGAWCFGSRRLGLKLAFSMPPIVHQPYNPTALTWEFPRMGDPNIVPQIVGSLF